MEEGINRGKTCPVLKIEEERLPSPRYSVLSDTESLAQERAYQQQLHTQADRLHQIKFVLTEEENAHILMHRDGRNQDAEEDETEDLEVYDSLEVAAQENRVPSHTKCLAADDGDGDSSPLLSDAAYFDLRYDPNWRTNLKGAGRFNESPHISVDEHYQNLKETSNRSCGDREGLLIKGGYRYVGGTSHKSFHLHSQSDQSSPPASPRYANLSLQLRSPEAELSGPFSSSSQNEGRNTLRRGVKENGEESCGNDGENIGRPPELTKDTQAVHIQDFQNYSQQELRHTKGGPVQTQERSTSTLTSPKLLTNMKPGSVARDIVESNKITLGRNVSTCGSYVKALRLQQGGAHAVKKVSEIRKAKRTQQKENPDTSEQQQPFAPEVKDEKRDSLSFLSAKPAPVTSPKPQGMASSQHLPPTVHLNIFLSTPSELLPVLQQTGQNSIVNLASLCGNTEWSSVAEVGVSPAYQTDPGKSTQMSQECRQTPALKSPLSCEGEDWGCPNKMRTEEFGQNVPRGPTTPLSQVSSPYSVLPPIGKVMTEKRPELCSGQSGNTARHIHRRTSDGYLQHMEKQKQMRARETYKAYSLKDDKQLESDKKLQGRGPDYAHTEKAAEKMERQRLYSTVIREQNKKISRIPFPPTRDPEGNEKRVPRMKALEYAKSIAKPPASHSQRQKHQPEGFAEQTPFLEGLEASQLATLELLRKRHVEEKQAAALLRKVYAV
ncbi:jhy protein homolog [Odontesthes bonariensis]|uniref:jhy protein homolog n=1 Tax=Odontesthes bonariensis TaxID=219752 RepID=UPI003F58E629